MEIKLLGPDGKLYQTFRKNENTYVTINGEEYRVLGVVENQVKTSNLTQEEKDLITKELVENEEIIKQLNSSNSENEEDHVTNIDEYYRFKNEVINEKPL